LGASYEIVRVGLKLSNPVIRLRFRNNSGSFVMRRNPRASPVVSSVAAARQPGSSSCPLWLRTTRQAECGEINGPKPSLRP